MSTFNAEIGQNRGLAESLQVAYTFIGVVLLRSPVFRLGYIRATELTTLFIYSVGALY